MLYKILQDRQELKEQATVLSEQELEKIYQKAINTVKREIEQEFAQVQEIKRQERKELHLAQKQFMKLCLQRYRTAPENSWIRNTIDNLVIANREIAGNSEREKIQHNAIVLRYIVNNPLTDSNICSRLQINKRFFKNYIDRGIDDLAILLFGLDSELPQYDLLSVDDDQKHG